MPSSYDLVVIGTGSGGAPAAAKCAADGWSVAIVDDQPFGGTCALRGCDPKRCSSARPNSPTGRVAWRATA